jgi:hypothetical protein
MGSVEAIWFKHPTLKGGETVQLAYPANYTQNQWRAVGGKLFITTQRVIFLPHVFDDLLGGKSIELSLESIVDLFVRERSLSFKELFSGGLVDRLGIRLNNGQEFLFVVWHVQETMMAIDAAALIK